MEKKVKKIEFESKFSGKDADLLIEAAKKSASGPENAAERKFWGAPEMTLKDRQSLLKIWESQENLKKAKDEGNINAIKYYQKSIEAEEDKLKESSEISAEEGVEKIQRINGASNVDIKEAQQAGQRLKSSVELALSMANKLIKLQDQQGNEGKKIKLSDALGEEIKEAGKKGDKDLVAKLEEERKEAELAEKEKISEEKIGKRKESREFQKELDDSRKRLASIDRSDPNYLEAEAGYKSRVEAMKDLMWRAKRDQLEKKEYLDEKTGKYRKLNPEEAKEKLDKYAREIIAPHFAVVEAAKIQNLQADQTFLEKVKDSRFAQFAHSAIDKYRKLPFKQKMLISGGLIATGLGAGVVGGAMGAGIAGAALLGKWTQRALSSGGTAMATEALIQKSHQKWMKKEGWGKNRHEFVSKEIDAIRKRVKEEDIRKTELEEVGGIEKIKEALNERKELENKLEKRRAGIALAVGTLVGSGTAFQGIKELSSFSGLSDFVSGKLTGVKDFFGWTREIAPEKIGKVGHVELKIGSRGPEGAIVNYFDKDSLVAKEFGWDGKADLHKWAGMKAHELWMDEAHKALSDPKVLSQMDHLGYEKDLNGYAEMMRKMGKGIVEMDTLSHKVDLVDIEYLKNGTGQLEQYDGPTVIEAEEVLDGDKENVIKDAIDDAKNNGMQAGDINAENLQKIMDNPDSKFGRIIANLYGSEQKGLKTAIDRIGGLEKFMDSPASILFYQEGQETSVFMEKFGLQLKSLTGDAYTLHDNVTPIKKILESIDSKKIYGGSAEDFLGTGHGGKASEILAEKVAESKPVEIIAEQVPGSDVPSQEPIEIIADKVPNSDTVAEKIGENIKESTGGIHNEAIVSQTGVRGIFKYSPEGNIQNVSVNGAGSILQGQTMLKDDWRATMLGKGASYLQMSVVTNRATSVFQYKELLDTLEKEGKGDSPEAEYLKRGIKRVVESTEKQFGDIFKK